MAEKTKKRKRSASKKVVKIRPKNDVPRISKDEAIFRDKMELHFGITKVDYLSGMFRAVQKFTGSVAELNQAHGFHILDVVSFKNVEGDEDGG